MNEWERQTRRAERIKELWPPGTRVLLIEMGEDPNPIPPNTRGTVQIVDDIGQIHCKFDNGRTLALIPGEDRFVKLDLLGSEDEQNTNDMGVCNNVIQEDKNEMAVKTVDIMCLRAMSGTEGLVLTGCGGDITEWVDGVNETLKEENILLEDTKFTDVYKFENENLTCLLFPFNDDVKLDMGKLAAWRIFKGSAFGASWFSDYVDNRLGGFEDARQKPDCELIGQDGNIFNLLGIAARTLRENDMKSEATEMRERVMASGSYEEALGIIGEYVNITGGDDGQSDGMNLE